MLTVSPNTNITKIQQANDIIDVVTEHIALTKKGREFVGLCPFHEDHRPSMTVSPQKQIFKCFACGAGGDVIKFVQMRENLTFPQALERLANRAGIEYTPPKRKSVIPSERSESRDLSNSDIDPNRLAKANAWAMELFKTNLNTKQGKQARDYLKSRNITKDSIETFNIGLALPGETLLETARKSKADLDILSKAGLTAGAHDKFTNRLMFPITDVTSRVIGFGGRTLDGSGAKYINSPTTVLFDKSNCLYGLEQARHTIVASGIAVLVEGYTDVIMAHQLGCKNVVASLGTSFTIGHGRILRRYAQNIVLIFDADNAGMAAANRALETCLSLKIDIKMATVPHGKDPCDFISEKGKDAFNELIENATDVFTYKWNRLKSRLDENSTIADKKQAVDDYLTAIAVGFRAGNLNAIEQGLYINKIASTLKMDPKDVKDQLDRIRRTAGTTRSYTNENSKVVNIQLPPGLAAAAQREILEVLLDQPYLYRKIKGRITTGHFDVTELKKIAEILFRSLENSDEIPLTDILAGIDEPEISNLVTDLTDTGAQKKNHLARLTDAADNLIRLQNKQKTESNDKNDDKMHKKLLKRDKNSKNPYSMGLK